MREFIPENHRGIPEQAKKVFQGEIFSVYQWPQKMFDGSIETFEMVSRPDSVDIIAVDGEDIIISQEEQPHSGQYFCLPAGMHDNPAENELMAAKRELKEETGYVFNNWKLIHVRQAGSGKLDHLLYTFLATELERIEEQELDVGEKITVKRVIFSELKELKYDSNMRFYPHHVLDDLESLDELLSLPPLHDYGN